MHSREQYLERVREDYAKADKRGKTRLLNEARKRTRLSRKVLIRKLAHPPRPEPGKRGKRKASYGVEVMATLVKVWEIFDYPCGQRLAPALREQLDRLMQAGEVHCSPEVAGKLKRVSPRTIDRLLGREKKVRCLRQNRNPAAHPLLYQKIPVKVASEWDTSQVGNLQIDYVLHCGRASGGEYVHTISVVDIATGWWEGEPILRRTQESTCEGMKRLRQRLPFRVREIHSDNDSGLINDLIWRYCRSSRIAMSRSRPYQKNDNAWVEQRNWTHVRKVVGYRRIDSEAGCELMRELYLAVGLYKNYFQPVMKLIEKVREGGKIHRKYDVPRTPYQRLCESGQITKACRLRLQQQYEKLNVAELKRQIESLRTRLFDLMEGKQPATLAKAQRRGPALRLTNKREHGRWIRQMLGTRKSQ